MDPQTQHKNQRKKIALLRLDRIGDFLLWISTAKYYRDFFRDYHVTFIGNSIYADLAQRLPFWDDFIPVNTVKLTPKGKSLPRFFDMLINLQHSRVYAHDVFAKKINALQKIAVNDVDKPNISAKDLEKANKFYTRLIDVDQQEKHELQRNFEILSLIVGESVKPTLENLEAFVQPLGTGEKKYAALYPGASCQTKIFPTRRFAHIARYLHQKYNLVIVLCGNKDDAAVCEQVYWNQPNAMINLCGNTKLIESLQIISGAELVITNDSMAAHASIMLNKKVISMVGGGYNSLSTGVGRFLPYPEDVFLNRNKQFMMMRPMECYGCQYQCKYSTFPKKEFPCIGYIDTDSIMSAIDFLLQD